MNETCPSAPSLNSFSTLIGTQLLTPLILSNCHLVGSYPKDKSSEVYSSKHPVYDFIIVGAGSAGCTIASRLSEVSNWTILLIEVGPDPPITSDIPSLHTTLLQSPYDWNYSTEPSDNTCLSYINHQCKQPRGKVLGGSSTINFMYAVRGNPKDYDAWESMGNPGWAYKDVLKYFKKLEDIRIPQESNEYNIHGYDGNVYIEKFTNRTLYDAVQARNYIANYTTEQGYNIIEDINANHHTGITLSAGTLLDDVRWSAAKAYLQPAKNRSNLIVMKETFVTKILINSQKRACGVEVYKDGLYKKIFSRKEIIVSAGCFNSPQLLMLSGIGPRDHLLEHGIEPVQNLNVGYNLQDHLIVPYFVAKVNLDSYRKIYPLPVFLYEYLSQRIDLGAIEDPMLFFNTTGHNADYPNIQTYHFVYPQNAEFSTSTNSHNFAPEIIKQIAELNLESPLLLIFPSLLRPKSRGRVFLKNADPFEYIKIQSGYLTEKDDIDALIESLKTLERLSTAKAFQKYGNLTSFSVKECSIYPKGSYKYYECILRHLGTSVYHPGGTCKMAPSHDPDAVVDHQLKVCGIKNLRVADSSIMPLVISGNLNLPTIMIGEKAADMIKQYWLPK